MKTFNIGDRLAVYLDFGAYLREECFQGLGTLVKIETENNETFYYVQFDTDTVGMHPSDYSIENLYTLNEHEDLEYELEEENKRIARFKFPFSRF